MGAMILVVGAGVAGTLAARSLALRGHRVLLVERERFPRQKVCGGCLGPEGVAALGSAGLGDLPARLGATPLSSLRLCASGRSARLPLEGGVALTRGRWSAWSPSVSSNHIRSPTRPPDPPALLLIGCYRSEDYERGAIIMAHAREGYVGTTVAESGRLIMAAALRPRAVQRWGIRGVVKRVLASAGRPAPPAGGEWRGTPAYVEPFTGEGMAWAMRSGLAVAEIAADGWTDDLGERWHARREELLDAAQHRCSMLTQALRWPGAVPLAVRLLRRFPSMAPRIVGRTTAWASVS